MAKSLNWTWPFIRFVFFICHTIIQSITSSEMCSLHLTHPSAHTLEPVGSWRCGTRGAVGGSVPCSRVSPQSWTILTEPRFEPTTSGYKSNALFIRPRLPRFMSFIFYCSNNSIYSLSEFKGSLWFWLESGLWMFQMYVGSMTNKWCWCRIMRLIPPWCLQVPAWCGWVCGLCISAHTLAWSVVAAVPPQSPQGPTHIPDGPAAASRTPGTGSLQSTQQKK